MENNTATGLQQEFRRLYGGDARIFRAPGRVNLIGEHTDYNDGFVMPAAIDFYVWIAIAARTDLKLSLYSTNFSESAEFDLRDTATPRAHWSDYIQGVATMLQKSGHRLRGANLLILGDVPIGSGLSSSAAIEVASALALLRNSGLAICRTEIARLCRRAENEFVGARVGIMDQFISCFGQDGHALLLDCRTLEHHRMPLPKDVNMVICNTMIKHELANGEYNTRRAECEQGVRLLQQFSPQAQALRDVQMEDLERHAKDLPEKIYRRCRHVIGENDRTQQAAAALLNCDLMRFGHLMNASHQSLRDDYEVSCKELDLMCELARKQKGVYGARMTGGGFGGCTINLVKSTDSADFSKAVTQGYFAATGITPQIFISSAAEGAGEVQAA